MSTQVDLFTNVQPTSVSPAIAKPIVSRSTFYQGDCLVEMDKIADKSVDMILCDLPYGTTETNWDKIISFDKLWLQYNRVITDSGAILLFGSQKFTIEIIKSNYSMFKYFLIWNKKVAGSFAMAQVRPMLIHEEISVFSKANTMTGGKNNMNYYPKLKEANPDNVRPINNGSSTSEANFGQRKNIRQAKSKDGYDNKKRYPQSIIEYSKYNAECNNTVRVHPTQKPVELLSELILNYTDEKMVVLDNCMGSGSTGVAAKKTGRHFIGIEKDEKYFKLAVSRVSAYCG